MSTSDQFRTHSEMSAALEFIQLGEKLKSGSLPANDGTNRVLERLSRSIDALLDALQSSNSLFLAGGGTMSWNSGTGAFTRSADIQLRMANEIGGAPNNVIPSATAITLSSDGTVAYAILDRETPGATATLGTSSSMANFISLITGDADRLDYQLIAYRDGTGLVLWDGRRILNGESLTGNGFTDSQYGQQTELDLVRANQKENFRILLQGGGIISWDEGTNTLTWDGSFELSFPSSAGDNYIVAGSSVVLAGEFLVATLTRTPGSSINISGTLSSVADGSVGSGDDIFVIGTHNASDGRFYLFDGTALNDGDSRLLGGALNGVQFFYNEYQGGSQVTDLQVEPGEPGSPYSSREYDVGDGSLMVYLNGVKAKGSTAYWDGEFGVSGSLVGSLDSGDRYVEEDQGSGKGHRIIWLRDNSADSLGHATGTHSVPWTWPQATDYVEAFVGIQGNPAIAVESLGIYPEPGGGPLELQVKLEAGSNIALAYDSPNNAIQISAKEVTSVERVTSSPRNLTSGDADGTLFAADTSGGGITVNLEASPSQGRTFKFKNMGTGGDDLTIGRNGQNINLSASDLVLTDLQSATLVFDATDGWYVL